MRGPSELAEYGGQRGAQCTAVRPGGQPRGAQAAERATRPHPPARVAAGREARPVQIQEPWAQDTLQRHANVAPPFRPQAFNAFLSTQVYTSNGPATKAAKVANPCASVTPKRLPVRRTIHPKTSPTAQAKATATSDRVLIWSAA